MARTSTPWALLPVGELGANKRPQVAAGPRELAAELQASPASSTAGDYPIVQDARQAWRARCPSLQEPDRAGSKPGKAAALTVASSGAPTTHPGQRRTAR